MEPWQQRVVDEHREVSDRLIKLTAFISGNEAFARLHAIDQSLLRAQRSAMVDYEAVITQRIARFSR